MTEAARDAGLVRSVGPLGLAASTVNAVVAAGIFALPGAIAASVGAYGPLAFVACAVAMGGVVLCFAEGGRRIATSGGCYGYIEAAFGPLAGFIAGILLVLSNCLASGGIAAALADSIATVFPPALDRAVHVGVILTALGVIAMVNLRGAASGTRLVGVTAVLKLVPLAVFIVVGASVLHVDNLRPTAGLSVHGFGRAMILAVFALTGMETALSASGEVARPERTIPQALFLVMLFVTVLYVVVQVVAQGVLGADLASSTAPLADAMGRVHPALRALLLGGAAVSMFGFLGADLLGTPRMLFALARDRFLPAPLGRLHRRTHAPYVAVLTYAVLVAALALTGSFVELAVLSTLTVAVLYLAGCGAVWVLARRGDAAPDMRVAAPQHVPRWLTVAAAVGISSMVLLIVLAERAEIAGLFAVVAVAVAGYWLRQWLLRGRPPG